MNYLDKQLKEANYNYNYFFIKLVFAIFQSLVKLSIMFLLSIILHYNFFNIIVVFYVIYTIYNICSLCIYYFGIINDIKTTLGYDELFFEIDFSLLNINFFRGVVKYGK